MSSNVLNAHDAERLERMGFRPEMEVFGYREDGTEIRGTQPTHIYSPKGFAAWVLDDELNAEEWAVLNGILQRVVRETGTGIYCYGGKSPSLAPTIGRRGETVMIFANATPRDEFEAYMTILLEGGDV